MRWTMVSPDEMAHDHGSACRPRMISRKCDTALPYVSHCCFDNISMGTLADVMFFTRCPSLGVIARTIHYTIFDGSDENASSYEQRTYFSILY